jgi:transposase
MLPTFRALSPRHAMWLLTLPDNQLKLDEIRYRDLLLQQNSALPRLYALIQSFKSLLTQRAADELQAWIREAQASGIHALQQFARGLTQDFTAVKAAFSLDWSSGQVEGQVNRLKFIKRQMCGRAHFDLLKKRVLYQIE